MDKIGGPSHAACSATRPEARPPSHSPKGGGNEFKDAKDEQNAPSFYVLTKSTKRHSGGEVIGPDDDPENE